MSKFWDKIKQDLGLYLAIIVIVCSTISLGIFIYQLHQDCPEQENKPFEIHQNVCFMPRDCFDTEKEYLDQFPEKEVPEYYPECLVYCTKNNLNYELFPIK